MILIGNIISALRPSYEYIVVDNDYDKIDWKGNDPIPYEEFIEAYNNFQALEEEKELRKQQALEKFAELGITPEDIKLVLG